MIRLSNIYFGLVFSLSAQDTQKSSFSPHFIQHLLLSSRLVHLLATGPYSRHLKHFLNFNISTHPIFIFSASNSCDSSRARRLIITVCIPAYAFLMILVESSPRLDCLKCEQIVCSMSSFGMTSSRSRISSKFLYVRTFILDLLHSNL